jgi:HlyD family secretion protein/epimerase transport system membrane fusion protein
MASEQLLFESTTSSLRAQQAILTNRVGQINNQIASLTAQVKAGDQQLSLIGQEIAAVAYLEKQQIVDKPRLLELQRQEAQLEGDRGDHLAAIAKAQQGIGETQQQMLQLMDEYRKETLSKLSEAQANLDDISEREKAAEDVLARTHIIAPRSGMVVNLKKHTVGGVISPGENVMDIVPSTDQLIIEAKINPLDIDVVHAGLRARIHLVAFKQRYMPTINGQVESVSTDTMTDPDTHQPYYLARVTLDKSDLPQLGKIRLDAGMPVQVMFVTDKRSFLSYLLDPLRESLFRAFHEQ